jgi:hypothetical protein
MRISKIFDDRSAFRKLWCRGCRVFADRQLSDRLIQAPLNTALSTTLTALFKDAGEPTPHVAFAQDSVMQPYREYGDGGRVPEVSHWPTDRL